jgi:MarR family transcriptional regulator, lower aerobic nicotinate degradation pathway regulator
MTIIRDMSEDPDDERPPLGFLLVRIGEAVDRDFVSSLTDLGLKPRNLRLLVLVDRAGKLNQRDLAGRLGMDPGNLVAILDGLEADGLVARPRSDADRRQRLVSLTPTGRRLLTRALRATAAIDERILTTLPASDRDRLYEMMLSVYRKL